MAEKMEKTKRISVFNVIKMIFLLPVVLAVFLGVYDYNRLIQIPYWSVFSFCYLFPDLQSPICSEHFTHSLVKWTGERWNWKLESAQPDTITAIPEMQASEFSFEHLNKLTKGFTVPAVVRGLFNSSAAVSKWTPEYFEERYGDNILIILGEGRPEVQYEKSEQEKRMTGGGAGYQSIMQPFKMKVKNALQRMKNGEKLYLSNVDTIFRRNNDLIDDLEFTDRIKPWAYENYAPFAAQMFMGYGSKVAGETTGTMMHSASSANLFVQAQGSKNWTFVSPRYSVLLSPSLGLMTPAAKILSPPKGVPMMHVMLNQGDVLLNPPWMWHEIRNQEGFNIGIATRENHPTWIVKNNWLFSFLLEFRATPRVAQHMIPKEKAALRFFAGIPFFSFSLVYLTELIKGPVPSPIFTAAYNPCDEHDPNSCTSTILDKTVYSDDVEAIPYRE